jgi:hypothetical protein
MIDMKSACYGSRIQKRQHSYVFDYRKSSSFFTESPDIETKETLRTDKSLFTLFFLDKDER